MIPDADREAFRRELLAYYDDAYFSTEYWKEDLPGHSGNRGLSYDDAGHETRFQLLARSFAGLEPGKSILDAGCGTGLLLRHLSGRFEHLAGVDASPTAIKLSRRANDGLKNVSLHQERITSLPFADESFGVVVCMDVLEHLAFFDVESAITELFRVARKDVILSINTDNPYKYHPTILSPRSWRLMLAAIPGFERNILLEESITKTVVPSRPEYDFYCYERSSIETDHH